jgi:hypothetical protein
MTIRQQISKALKEALRKKDLTAISTLRLLEGALKNKEIALRSERRKLSDEDILAVLRKEAKKRREAIEAFQKGGRDDLVLKEKKELKIIERYLPKQLSEEEVKKIIQKIIKKIGEVSERDFGRIMREAMAELKGKAEGRVVSRVVREELLNG